MNAMLSRLGAFSHKLLPWLLLIIIIAFCWFLAAVIWLMVAPPKAITLSPVAISTQAKQSRFDADVFNIFKVPEVKVIETPKVQIDTSGFKLEGVFVSSNSAISSAVINYQGNAKRYAVGETVSNTDFRLDGVDWNGITLKHSNGETVTLNLTQKLDLNSGAHIKANIKENDNHLLPPDHFDFSNQVPQQKLNSFNPKLPKVTKKPVNTKQQVNNMLDKAVSELQSNPAGYLNKMGVMATGDSYEITDAMNSQIRANIGLQPGDKVISVNGQTIGQPQQDANLLREIQQTGSAEIQIQRGQQVITVRQQF